MVSLQPSYRAKSRLQAPVIGLEEVIRMDLRAMEDGRERLIEHARIERRYRSVVISTGEILERSTSG